MKKTTNMVAFADLPKSYDELVRLLPPRPVRDSVDRRNVEEVIQSLAGHKLTRDQEDYLDLLSDLALAYDAEKRQISQSKLPVRERLRFIMDESEMSASDLAAAVGCSRSLIALVLSGERQLSKSMILKLAEHFRLTPGYFL